MSIPAHRVHVKKWRQRHDAEQAKLADRMALARTGTAAEWAEARRRYRDVLRRQLEEEAEGPPAFRLTLAGVRAAWPEWIAVREQERGRAFDAVREQYGATAGALATLLVDIHVPAPPPPAEVVAYALDLECGHEAVWLVKLGYDSATAPERERCPIYLDCRLSHGRTVVRYVEPGEPMPKWTDLNLRRRSSVLACGHSSQVYYDSHETAESSVGDYQHCQTCRSDAEIVALGERLPDEMVQDWTVDLSCGHRGTDPHIPVDSRDDPAGHRAQKPHSAGLACYATECMKREVRGVRRLGVVEKKRRPTPPTPKPDPVERAASDLRRRLTTEERQALIRRLQEDD